MKYNVAVASRVDNSLGIVSTRRTSFACSPRNYSPSMASPSLRSLVRTVRGFTVRTSLDPRTERKNVVLRRAERGKTEQRGKQGRIATFLDHTVRQKRAENLRRIHIDKTVIANIDYYHYYR